MSELATIGPTARTIYPGNDNEGDGNRVEHIDPGKSILSRIVGRMIWPGREGEATKQAPPPAPRIPPEEELAQQKTLLAHLEGQLRSAKAILANDPNRPSSTAPNAVHGVTQHYARKLESLEDVAGMALCDVPLLIHILARPGEGLISAVAQRVGQLDSQVRPAIRPSEEHRRLISAATKAMKQWAKAHRALREFEATVSQSARHKFRGTRPACGLNFGQIDERTLERVADFAASLPDAK